MSKKRFRIAFSYSSVRKTFVESVVKSLAEEHPVETLMLDTKLEHEIVGVNLDLRLQDMYKHNSELIVVCVCKSWLESAWCRKEWRAIRSLIGSDNQYRILPVMFERVDVPRLDFESKDACVKFGGRNPEEIARLISRRWELVMAKRPDETLAQTQPFVTSSTLNSITKTDSWQQSSSDALANWPKELPDGRRIERPELAKIFEKVAGSRRSTHVLLGPLGSGKSALLSEL